MDFKLRKAVDNDIPALRLLIDASVRGLQARDYTVAQIEIALEKVYGIDTQLIADETYFVVEAESAEGNALLVGCGGWSKRKPLYGGNQWRDREPEQLDPERDAAKIRAFFVHPNWARQGIGTLILQACESAAAQAGFRRLEMGATLTGVPFYRARGYLELEPLNVTL